MSPTDESHPPILRVVRGDATDEEIAALLAVVAARSRGRAAAGPTGPGQPISAWGHPSTALRPRLQPGPGAWRNQVRAR